MTCYTTKPRRMTLGEVKDAAGYKRGPGSRWEWGQIGKAEYERLVRDFARAESEPLDVPSFHICGDLGPRCSDPTCGDVGDLLCDWPMGNGETCDLPICEAHARSIGEDRDLCLVHWPMWRAAGGLAINPWPPSR